MNSRISVLLFFLFVFLGKAQQDTTKIKSYEDQVMVRVNLDTNIEDYVFNFKDGNRNLETKLTINNKINTSISLDYRIISATLSFAPRFIPGNRDNELKGKSSYSDIRFRFFPKRFIQAVYYKNVKGFYIENMKDFFPDWREGIDPYYQFPDLRIQSFGGATSYVLNKDFSLKSIYYQREWQKNSGGSWIPTLDYDITFFRNKTEGLKRKETQINIGTNMGYYYNWVMGEKVNVSPFLSLGFGGKFTSFKDTLEDGTKAPRENEQFLTIRFAGGIHAGYNSDQFLFGGKINFSSYAYSQDKNSTIENNNIYGLLYIGYRFAPPKAVKRNYDKIKEKIPIL